MSNAKKIILTIGYRSFILDNTAENIAACAMLSQLQQVDQRYVPGPGYKQVYVATNDTETTFKIIDDVKPMSEAEYTVLREQAEKDKELEELRVKVSQYEPEAYAEAAE